MRRAVKGLLLVLTAAGCAPHDAEEIARYRTVLDTVVPPPQELEAGETLSLERAIALANIHHEQLAVRGEEYLQALIAQHRQVSNFLPSISLQPNFTLEEAASGAATKSPGIGSEGNAQGSETSGSSTTPASGFRSLGDQLQRTEVPLIAAVNLFHGFSDVESLRSLDSTLEQRRELLLDLQATVLLDVARTYYQTIRNDQLVAVLRDSVGLREQRLKEVQSQFEHGLATSLAVAQSTSELQATRVRLTRGLNDAQQARSTLAFLLGRGQLPNPLSDSYSVPSSVASLDELLSIGRTQRHDLIAAKFGRDAAQHAAEAALGEYYPSVTLRLTGFLYREYYEDASRWNGILSANIPIFSAGVIEADVRNAWSKLRQAGLTQSYLERNAALEVQLAYQNFAATGVALEQVGAEVQAANEAYQQAVSASANGLATNLDVLQAQDILLQARLDLTNTKADRVVNYLQLLRTSGLFPERGARSL